MAREIKANVPNKLRQQASFEFCHAYGLAMAEWAGVERALYHWFAGITGMIEGMARSIFYSARSFNGRAEMLEAAISNAKKQSKEEIEFISFSLKKAWGYSGFRNSIAHGEPLLNLHLSGTQENPVADAAHYQLVQGKNLSLDPNSGQPISIEHLNLAAANFHLLANAVTDAIPWIRHRHDLTLEQCRSRVDLLPNQPNSKIAPIHVKPSKPQNARVNKKAHRAAQQAAKPNHDE